MSDESQQEAEKKVDVPDEVMTEQEKQKEEAADARGAHLQLMEKNKELAAKYGEPDFQSFLNRIGSDGVFAQQFVQDHLSGEDNIPKSLLPDSPQEKNVTGKVDHTGDTPVRAKTAAATDNKVAV